jgi:hypothetical protein
MGMAGHSSNAPPIKKSLAIKPSLNLINPPEYPEDRGTVE